MPIARKSLRIQPPSMIFIELWRAGVTFRQCSKRSHHFRRALRVAKFRFAAPAPQALALTDQDALARIDVLPRGRALPRNFLAALAASGLASPTCLACSNIQHCRSVHMLTGATYWPEIQKALKAGEVETAPRAAADLIAAGRRIVATPRTQPRAPTADINIKKKTRAFGAGFGVSCRGTTAACGSWTDVSACAAPSPRSGGFFRA